MFFVWFPECPLGCPKIVWRDSLYDELVVMPVCAQVIPRMLRCGIRDVLRVAFVLRLLAVALVGGSRLPDGGSPWTIRNLHFTSLILYITMTCLYLTFWVWESARSLSDSHQAPAEHPWWNSLFFKICSQCFSKRQLRFWPLCILSYTCNMYNVNINKYIYTYYTYIMQTFKAGTVPANALESLILRLRWHQAMCGGIFYFLSKSRWCRRSQHASKAQRNSVKCCKIQLPELQLYAKVHQRKHEKIRWNKKAFGLLQDLWKF